MPLLNEEIRREVAKFLEGIPRPVRLVMFTQEFECEYCADTRQLVEELAEISDRIVAEIYDFQADRAKAEELGIDKIPAIAVIGEQDYGVRFYGIPSGYEFTSLLYAIRYVSEGKTELSDATLKVLEGLTEPVHIQVFVTPTCPYCPQAVTLAHQMAVASPMVRADMVEATEFPHLAYKYQVMGVPRTVINEKVHIEGAVPESYMVAKLQEAVR
ncbi:MAG: thioredoxin family protein [Anaerolineae bacterium]|nr:thioredoxin family protein [Anaerolineae bacterium]MDW7992264.1 thioredoxin family protein [Anaerolineae bacterium]